jgi:hypothetical protein
MVPSPPGGEDFLVRKANLASVIGILVMLAAYMYFTAGLPTNATPNPELGVTIEQHARSGQVYYVTAEQAALSMLLLPGMVAWAAIVYLIAFIARRRPHSDAPRDER